MGARGAVLPRGQLLAYALPGVVLAIPTLPITIYLPSLYGAELGLAAAGLALLIARGVDVFTDPAIGILSDRFRPRWGRRKPWIALGGLVGGLALVQLFHPPADVTFGYLVLWSLILYLGWTLISVPYNAWAAEMSPDYHERTRVTGAREAAMLVGMVIAGAWPSVAFWFGAGEHEALGLLSWIAVLAGAPAMAWMLLKVPDPLPDPESARDPRTEGSWKRFRSALAVLAGNRPFMRLIAAWFVNGLANGIPAALFLLFLEHRLAADAGERGGLILLYFLAAVGGIPLWLALSRRIGKHRTWCLAMALTCFAFVWAPLLAPGDMAGFAVICVVTGIGLGADLALPPAIQADVIDVDVGETGRNRAGLFFALWGMATKLAVAAGIGIAFPALAYFGFDARGASSAEGLQALAAIYALVPVALKIIAITVVWNFPLSAVNANQRNADAGTSASA